MVVDLIPFLGGREVVRIRIIEEVTSTVTGTWSADGNELTVDLGAGAGVSGT